MQWTCGLNNVWRITSRISGAAKKNLLLAVLRLPTFLNAIFYTGQMKIKYPDVTGDFVFADLVKGGTGLGKLKQGNLDYQSPNELYLNKLLLSCGKY